MRLAKATLIAALMCASGAFAETFTENATVEGGDPIVIADGTELEYNIAVGATVTVTRVISGPGTFVKSGGGRLILNAENTFSGGLSFKEGEIIVKSEGALGTGTVTYSGSVKHIIDFQAKGATFNNNIVFSEAGSIYSESRPQIRFYYSTIFNGDITGPSSGTVRIGGQPHASSTSDPMKYQTAVLNGTMDFSRCTLGIATYGIFKFNGKLTAPTLTLNREWAGQGILYINHPESKFGTSGSVTSYCPSIHCGAENVISNMSFLANYRHRDRMANNIDLHGHNQTMRAITINPMGNSGYLQPHASELTATDVNGPGHFNVTSSERPATLTLTGTGANKTNYTYHAFGGELSLVLDADPAYTLVLSNRTHTMTGALTVSNGTLRAVDAATFRAIRRLAVSQGATFELETTKEIALASLKSIDIYGKFAFSSESMQSVVSTNVEMSIGANAEISLPAGMTLKVKSLTVDGQTMEDGTYDSNDIDQLASGRIEVRAAGYTLAEVWPEPIGVQYVLETTGGETNRIDDMTVKVVESGVTNEVTFSSLGTLTGGTIRKIGDGVVISSRSLSSFSGNIFIDEGGFALENNTSAGPANTSTAAKIWVRDGASLIIAVTKSTYSGDRTSFLNSMFLCGDGYNGLGAIDLEHVSVIPSFGGRLWVLLGDTRISGYSTTRTDQSNTSVLMMGHRLTFKRPTGRTSAFPYYWDTVGKDDSGEILSECVQFVPQGTVYWAKGDSRVVVSNATFSFYNSGMSVSYATTLEFKRGTANSWSCGGSTEAPKSVLPGDLNQSWWDGLVQVDGSVSIYGTALRKGAVLRGKVTGDGAIKMSSGWLHLQNPENDFTASVAVVPTTTASYKPFEMGLCVYADGALPLSCRSVAITNGHFAVYDAIKVNLPAVAYHTTSGTNVRFYANSIVKRGTLAGLRKTGPGTLTYTAPIAITGALEVVEGTLSTGGTTLSGGTLAIAGGTIDGDVTAAGLKFGAASVGGGAYRVLNISGALAFEDGAALDFDGLFNVPAAERPALSAKQAVVRAEGGITGLPKAVAGTVTAQKHLAAVVEGNTLYVCRISGTTVTIR